MYIVSQLADDNAFRETAGTSKHLHIKRKTCLLLPLIKENFFLMPNMVLSMVSSLRGVFPILVIFNTLTNKQKLLKHIETLKFKPQNKYTRK